MSNLPGTCTMRLLPFHGAIGGCQLWQRLLAKTARTQCAGLTANSNIFTAYRSLRCRLMRRMSAAMQKRRPRVSFLKKAVNESTSAKNDGRGRLVDTCCQPQMKAKIWANLQAQRSFATTADHKDTTGLQGQRPKQRTMVPVLEFEEPPVDKLEDFEIIIDDVTSRLNSIPKFLKKRQMVPILRILEADANLRQTPSSKNKTNNPVVSTNPRVARKKSFEKRRSPMRIRYEMQPSYNHQFSANNDNFELKHSSTLPYLMSKYPLMHKLPSPTLPYLQPTNGVEQGLDTFETRLRALRTSQPLNLRLPSLADRNSLSVTQQYRRDRQSRYALPHFSKKLGPMLSFRPITMTVPSVKAHKMPPPQKKMCNVKFGQKVQAKKDAKPKKVEPIKNVIEKRPEREDLNHLLDDLLGVEQKTANFSIPFKKTAPLYKVVSTSMEGRSNLHKKSFTKQLEGPQLFRHPTIKRLSQSPNIKRRGAFLGQLAAFRAKTQLKNKLTHLLKIDRQMDDEDDDDNDDDEDIIEDNHQH